MTWKILLSSSTNEKKKKKKKKVERSSSVFQCGVDVWLDGGQVMQARCHCFYYGLVHGAFFLLLLLLLTLGSLSLSLSFSDIR